MGISLAKSGLVIRKGNYRLERFTESAEMDINALIAKYISAPGVVVTWQVQEIAWGRFDGKQVTLLNGHTCENSLLVELRVFNDKEELQLVKVGDRLEGRYVNDSGSEEVEYVDSFSRIWGETLAYEAGVATLQDRGRKLHLQVPAEENAQYYGLTTRNYIQYSDKTGQAGYSDYRFVAIESAEGGK